MIDDSVQAKNADGFGMSEHDVRPNYGSDNENRDDEKRDDENVMMIPVLNVRRHSIELVVELMMECYHIAMIVILPVLILARKMTKLWIQQLVLSDLF